MAHRFTLRATPAAARAVRSLRGRAKDAYERLEPALRAEGCKAAGYRLLAADRAGYSDYCCKHLADEWRLITRFESRVVFIEAVGQHDGTAFYASRSRLGIGAVGQARNEKPDCCGEEGWPHLGSTRPGRHVRALA